MYRITARQILVIALASALFATVTVLGVQQLSSRWQPFGAAAPATSTGVIADPALATDEQNNIEVYKAVSPGVVYIQSSTTVSDFFGFFTRPVEGAGSGSIIDPQGDILTNYHVIAGAEKLTVTFGGGKSYPARVVGKDPDTDLAVIRLLEQPKEPMTVVPMGDSDHLVVGQKVLAIGNPFGLDRTLTTGVISGLQRPIRAENNRQIEGAIQTDAAINPGNSGGPLLDSHGRMIGINSQIESPSGASAGVGFAIPISIARRIVPELVKNGSVQHPKLGIDPRDIESLGHQDELPVSYGVLIVGTQRGGPAANAGLRGLTQTEDGIELGDIIVGVDGEKVSNNDDLLRLLDKHQIGDTVKVEVVRRGRRTVVPVQLTEVPTNRRRGFGEE
ncbi:MAG TPA: trypsin-like peptidase domain-containing protein [Pyrinomonadaceae bacterium]|jgi:S1-C subfamily serine protease|nr:trypsin-like peptidase domain-containing protein [Pyrinomonadaceae bacterium]